MNLLVIELHIYFDLHYLGLSWSHDMGHGFERLTQVDLD